MPFGEKTPVKRNKKKREQNSQDFSILPSEIWIEILSYLSVPELCKCAQLSKFHYQVSGSNELWQTKIKNDIDLNQPLPSLCIHWKTTYKALKLKSWDYLRYTTLYRVCSSVGKETLKQFLNFTTYRNIFKTLNFWGYSLNLFLVMNFGCFLVSDFAQQMVLEVKKQKIVMPVNTIVWWRTCHAVFHRMYHIFTFMLQLIFGPWFLFHLAYLFYKMNEKVLFITIYLFTIYATYLWRVPQPINNLVLCTEAFIFQQSPNNLIFQRILHWYYSYGSTTIPYLIEYCYQ